MLIFYKEDGMIEHKIGLLSKKRIGKIIHKKRCIRHFNNGLLELLNMA